MARTNYRWMWGLLLVVTICITSGTASAEESTSPVGIVIMATGVATADDGSGTPRALQRRSEIFNKDVITTDKASRLQIRFSDGALVSLQEESNFKIKDYRYQSGAGKGDNAAYALLKGSMRTISGAIGKVNKSDYKVETPVATIGIRGTDYELVLHNNPKTGEPELYGYINDGVINVANSGGDEDFGFNQFFKVGGDKQPPQQLLNPPDFMFEGYVPPQPEGGAAYVSPIFFGSSTGIANLLTDVASYLPDIYNPAITPFSTVSNISGQYIYNFDSTLVDGFLPSVQNGPSAVSASSFLNIDFTSQTITYASVNVVLSDTTSMDATTLQGYSLSDVIAKGQSMALSGSHWDNSTFTLIAPTTGTLGVQLLGGQAQGALGTYNITETGMKLPVSVTGNALYQQQQLPVLAFGLLDVAVLSFVPTTPILPAK